MKNILKIFTPLILLLLASCNKEGEKAKVTYENTPKNKVQVAVDTSQIQLADLPVQMPGTNYLIHPIADLNISDRNESGQKFKISNYSEYEITGYLRNLKFQQIGTDSLRPLSVNPVLIQTITYLKSVSDKQKQQILVYTLSDTDTNKDGKLDENDIKSLYLSEISGNRFTKVSTDFEELIDWSLIESNSRLYFRTIEDTNKNGKFDKDDIVKYHYIDLSGKDWKVSDYSPIS